MRVNPTRDGGSMAEADGQLIASARRGDRAARERLVRAHRREVYRIACAILGDEDDAEDATQEALVRMLRGLRGFDERRDFRAWLRRIAVNCAIDVRRRRRPEAEAVEAEAPGDPAAATSVGLMQGAVRRALAELPERQRVALSLFALGELDLRATAEAMGCAEGTVKSHLHRGRATLREMLSDWLED